GRKLNPDPTWLASYDRDSRESRSHQGAEGGLRFAGAAGEIEAGGGLSVEIEKGALRLRPVQPARAAGRERQGEQPGERRLEGSGYFSRGDRAGQARQVRSLRRRVDARGVSGQLFEQVAAVQGGNRQTLRRGGDRRSWRLNHCRGAHLASSATSDSISCSRPPVSIGQWMPHSFGAFV